MNRGFSLTEVIVVVAIVALLVAVGIEAYSTSREKAEALTMVQQLQSLEAAFVSYKNYELTGGWPQVVFSNSEADLRDIVSGGSTIFPSFNQYFSEYPEVFEDFSVNYHFGAGSPGYRCSGSGFESTGVNIMIEHNTTWGYQLGQYFEYMNDKLDGDDPDTGCGQLRRDASTGHVYYNIASSTYSY